LKEFRLALSMGSRRAGDGNIFQERLYFQEALMSPGRDYSGKGVLAR
jgi:hypothetical protein